MDYTKYIGNCSAIINCNELCAEIKIEDGHFKTAASPYSLDINLSDDLKEEAISMYEKWKSEGYIDSDVVEWINFYPKKNFRIEHINKLATFLQLTPKNVWISSIKPGKCVPWHWDIESNASAWMEEGNLVRYTVFIDRPKVGHILIVQKDIFHMIEQGSIYRWNTWNDYHIGVNIGFGQKYVLHIVGIENGNG
jgi:hypothetical protein